MMRAVLVAALLCGVFISCSDRPSEVDVAVAVEFQSLLPKDEIVLNLVDHVVLTISAPDLESRRLDLPVVQGIVTASLDVPPGRNRVFDMKAVDANEHILYAGADTVNLGQAFDQRVVVTLRPVGLLMRVSPLYQEVAVGQTGKIDIVIFNVDSLYGAAFRVLYDEALIRIDRSRAGTFLGTDDTVFYASFDQDEDTYAIAVTRKRIVTVEGKSGHGILASIDFTALVPGTATIGIGIESSTALGKPDGSPVDGIEGLVLDGGQVVIRGTD
jgi:hypothetical protein